MIEHKKYALLENGKIEPLYYDFVWDDGTPCNEPRHIEEENGEYFLVYDVLLDGSIALKCSKIIKEADTMEELENESNVCNV